MNTSLFRKFILSASLLLLPLLAGCSPKTSAPTPTSTDTQAGSNDAPAMLASAAPAAETSGAPDPAPPPPDPGPVPVAPDPPAVANELPADVSPTSPLAQVIRLTQAGVDQSIIQTFVANASGTFNLDSDRIIYLRDLGVPNEVVTAMMQHDQQLRQQAAAANPTPAQPAPDTNAETGPPPEPPPPPTEVTINNFYGPLAPYGTWVNVDGYGRCWRPSVVAYNPGWQPYCDNGHWVYTSCGWYWYSDYSWGWAPFHYGRWFQHPNMGWCWTPDTVWGPSWVTWRYSNNYCGWAPLPPFAMYRSGFGFFYRGSAVSIGFNWGLSAGCFTFVPTQFFCDPHPRNHCVDRSQVPVVFNQTTVVNNFNVRNHNFVNQGIDPEHITAITRVPIHPVALQHATSPYGNGPHQDRFNRDANTLVVNHPDFADHPAPGGNRNNPPPPAGPRTQNDFPQPNDHHPATPPHSTPQPQFPIVTTHGPQAGNAVYQPPQRVTPTVNDDPTPTPNQNNRTDSPRGWEQHQSRGNGYNPGTPAVTPPPAQPQPGAPAAVPSQHHQQNSQPASPPPASAPQRSSSQNQNQNQNQGGSGNNSSSSTGHGSNH